MSTVTPTGRAPARWNRRPAPGSRAFNRERARIVVASKLNRERVKQPGALIAATDLDPFSVEWPVKDLQVLLTGDDSQRDFTMRLVQALLTDGARHVAVLWPGTTPPCSHHWSNAIVNGEIA